MPPAEPLEQLSVGLLSGSSATGRYTLLPMPVAHSPEAAAPAASHPARLHAEISLALHAVIAERLDAAGVEHARAAIERWLAEGGPSEPLLRRWQQLLTLPLDEIRAAIVDPAEEAAWLRKASPFAGILRARERERIIREVRRRRQQP